MEEDKIEELKSWVYQEIIKLQKQIDDIKEKIRESEIFKR